MQVDADDLLKTLRRDAARLHWKSENTADKDIIEARTQAEPQGFTLRLPTLKLPQLPMGPGGQRSGGFPKSDNASEGLSEKVRSPPENRKHS